MIAGVMRKIAGVMRSDEKATVRSVPDGSDKQLLLPPVISSSKDEKKSASRFVGKETARRMMHFQHISENSNKKYETQNTVKSK